MTQLDATTGLPVTTPTMGSIYGSPPGRDIFAAGGFAPTRVSQFKPVENEYEYDSSFYEGLRNIAIEANAVLSFGRFLEKTEFMRADPEGPDFDVQGYYNDHLNSRLNLNEAERDRLFEEDTKTGMLRALRDIGTERRMYATMGRTGAAGFVVGLASGLIDPVNFVPFLGIGSKIAKAGQISSGIDKALKVQRIGAKSRFARGATEAMAAESVLQTIIHNDRIDPSEEYFAANVAMAGAFGGLFNTAFGYRGPKQPKKKQLLLGPGQLRLKAGDVNKDMLALPRGPILMPGPATDIDTGQPIPMGPIGPRRRRELPQGEVRQVPEPSAAEATEFRDRPSSPASFDQPDSDAGASSNLGDGGGLYIAVYSDGRWHRLSGGQGGNASFGFTPIKGGHKADYEVVAVELPGRFRNQGEAEVVESDIEGLLQKKTKKRDLDDYLNLIAEREIKQIWGPGGRRKPLAEEELSYKAVEMVPADDSRKSPISQKGGEAYFKASREQLKDNIFKMIREDGKFGQYVTGTGKAIKKDGGKRRVLVADMGKAASEIVELIAIAVKQKLRMRGQKMQHPEAPEPKFPDTLDSDLVEQAEKVYQGLIKEVDLTFAGRRNAGSNLSEEPRKPWIDDTYPPPMELRGADRGWEGPPPKGFDSWEDYWAVRDQAVRDQYAEGLAEDSSHLAPPEPPSSGVRNAEASSSGVRNAEAAEKVRIFNSIRAMRARRLSQAKAGRPGDGPPRKPLRHEDDGLLEERVGTQTNQPESVKASGDPSDALQGRPVFLRTMVGKGVTLASHMRRGKEVVLSMPDAFARDGHRQVFVIRASLELKTYARAWSNGKVGFPAQTPVIEIDVNQLWDVWARTINSGKNPVKEILDRFGIKTLPGVFSGGRGPRATFESMTDFMLLHEMQHVRFRTKRFSEYFGRKYDLDPELARLYHTDRKAFRQKVGDEKAFELALERAVDQEAAEEFDKAWRMLEGSDTPNEFSMKNSTQGGSPAPAPSSIEVANDGVAANAFVGHLELQGYKRRIAEVAVRLWAHVSPDMRMYTNPIPTARDLYAGLQPTPLRTSRIGGNTIDTQQPAKTRRQVRWESRANATQALARREIKKINKGLDRKDRKTTKDISERFNDAMNLGDTDQVNDQFSKLINDLATRTRKDLKEVLGETKKYIDLEDAPLSEGETWFRRIWNHSKILEQPDEFRSMLKENGVEDPRAFMDSIMEDPEGFNHEFITGRGALRGRVELPYEAVKPFIQTDGFATLTSTMKLYGGELEAQRTIDEWARNIKENRPVVWKNFVNAKQERLIAMGVTEFSDNPRDMARDNRGFIDMQLVSEAIRADARRIEKGGRAMPEYMTKDLEEAELQEVLSRHPELADSPEFEGLRPTDKVRITKIKGQKLEEEVNNAIEILRVAMDDVRGRDGIPDDPDSFWKTRLPNTIMNLTHMAFGGGVGLATILDQGRIVGMYGLKNTFRDGWEPWITRSEYWNYTKKEAEFALQASEGIRSHWARTERNMSAHQKNGTLFESAAAKGAQWMNTLSGLTYVADLHQLTEVAVSQSFLIDAVTRAHKGQRLEAWELARLDLMNVGDREIAVLGEQMAVKGGLLEIDGHKAINREIWTPENQTLFSETIKMAAYQSGSLPGRMELPLNSTDPWKRVLWQYRNWIWGNTNRILISSITHLDKVNVMGVMAGLGLGTLIYGLKAQLGLIKPPDSIDDWAMGSVDQSGVLAILSEGNNLIHRGSGGAIGLGAQENFAADTTMGALIGPSWGLTKAARGAVGVATAPAEPSPMDIHRVRQGLPGNQLFWLKSLLDEIDPGARE